MCNILGLSSRVKKFNVNSWRGERMSVHATAAWSAWWAVGRMSRSVQVADAYENLLINEHNLSRRYKKDLWIVQITQKQNCCCGKILVQQSITILEHNTLKRNKICASLVIVVCKQSFLSKWELFVTEDWKHRNILRSKSTSEVCYWQRVKRLLWITWQYLQRSEIVSWFFI